MLLLSIGLVVGLFLIVRQLLLVKQVAVQFNNLVCDDPVEIQRVLNQWQRQTIFDQFRVDGAFYRKFWCVSQVEVTKKLPNNLEVKVEGRRPVAVIFQESSLSAQIDLSQLEATSASRTAWLNWGEGQHDPNREFWVDHLGFLFAKAQSIDGLPQVYWVNDELEVGKQLNDEQLRNLELIIQKLGPMQLMRVNEAGNLMLVKPDKKRLLFSLNRDVNVALASLQLIQQKSKIESKEVDLIDLRFDKPVVIYSR